MRVARGAGLAMLAASTLLGAACGSSQASKPPAPARSGAAPAPPTTAAPADLSAAPAAWQLPAAVSRPVVVPSGTGFLILGGLATGDTSTDRVVQVDPAAGSATLAGTLALAVHDSAGADLGGRALVFGGGSYSTVSTVQAWSGGHTTEIAHLPSARSDLATVTVGSTAYIIGGFDGSQMDPEVLATTDGATFRTVASLPIPVRYPAVGYADGAIWVLGGVTSTSEGGTLETSAIQRVDPVTGQSAVVGHLPQPMGHATAVTLSGQIFVLGGRSGTVPSSAILRLDPATASVQQAGTLPQALSDAGSVVVGDTGYLVGGEVSGPTAPLTTVVTLRLSGSAR